MVGLTWFHAILIALVGPILGYRWELSLNALFSSDTVLHAVAEGGVVAFFAILAGNNKLSRRWRATAVGFGLMSSSAILVHLSGGYIELHFHFFVMLVFMALYQDWTPYILAILYVAVHHGVVGVLWPQEVYNHTAALNAPWTWAGIHAFFIMWSSAGSIIAWRYNEQAFGQARLVLESADEGIFGLNKDGEIIFMNPAAIKMLGLDSAHIIGQPIFQVLRHTKANDTPYHHDEAPILAPLKNRTPSYVTNELFWRADGTNFAVDFRSSPIIDRGEVDGVVVSFNDVTERKRIEESIRNRTEQIIRHQNALLRLAKVDNSVIDLAFKQITEVDAETLGVERVSIWRFNKGRSEIVCEDLYKLSQGVHENGLRLQAKQYPRYFKAMDENRTVAANDARTDPRTSEFSEGYLEPLGITSMLDVPIWLHGEVIGVVCHEHIGSKRTWTLEEQDFGASIADMVSLTLESWERKQAETELEKSVSLLSATLESTADGILVVDNTGKIVSSNEKFLKMWRLPKAPSRSAIVSGEDEQALAFILNQLKDPDGFLKKVRELYAQPDAESYDILEFKDGRILERYSQPQRIEGKSVGRVWSFRDISQRVKAERALAEQAIRDSLTNLYNRRHFNSRIPEEIARADRSNQLMAILLCDLDHFKVINDTRGHQAGDEVLKAVARSIQESTRGTDLVFRWGGDEIVVVISNTTREGILTAVDRIRKSIHAAGQQVDLDLDLSIGVALYPEHGRHIDELIRLADRALYIAKKGGDKIHIGEEEYRLDEHTIKVVFQPIVDVSSHIVLGQEALSRDPQGKLNILEMFKRYQAVGQLNELKCICFKRQLTVAEQVGLKRVFINVDFNVLSQMESLMKPAGIEVILEISELEALHDVDNRLILAQKWREKGFKFAIDDFGAGFVSLPFIARLIPDYIKLDRSTVLQAVSSEKFRDFVKDLLRAIQNYSKEGIIAEGIETEKELRVMKSIGIHLIQGFLVGKPQEIK
jgi:diguanylate cyclase (GGDEF)-like protein/PAS domain S-box-containing protein